MSSLKLRDYQEGCLQSIYEHHEEGVNRQLVHLPTGAGKTVIFAHLIQELERKTLVLAHTIELVEQARDKIKMLFPDLEVGVVMAGSKEYDRPIVVSSIQSARQPETLENLKKQNFTLCIYDECHRAAANTPREVLRSLGFIQTPDLDFTEEKSAEGKLLVGFSATPFREDSKGLGEIFEKIVYKQTTKDLIAYGYLCKPRGIRIKSDLDLSCVATADGDFEQTSLASVMNTTEMNELVVNSFVEHAPGRRTVCFCVTIDHAQALANEFRRRGIAAAAIHGGTPEDERKSLLRQFKEGSLSILTNCQLLTEGWDCPEVDCVIVAKPTQSRGLFQQMAGRGLRLYPNKKDCLILDFGSKSHSLCSTAVLVNDSDSEEFQQEPQKKTKVSEFVNGLPKDLNKKLKAAIIEFDILGDDFTWIKDGETFSLKADGGKILKIFPSKGGGFVVVFFDGNNYQTISRELPFEYAFACAEEFAKANRSLFIISDLSAPWRQSPISEKQKNVFKSYRYKTGIDGLSKGQASIIISSGVLKRKAARR